MKMTRRILSWVLAIALVVTCGITGLVLPVAAVEAPADLLNGQGTFEDGTDYASTALGNIIKYQSGATAAVVDNPNGEGKVVQIGKFVDEDGDGVNDGKYSHTSYPQWKKLYNAETGTYTKYMEAGKSYTLSLDVYGDGIGLFFQGDYHVTSFVAEDCVGGENGWFQLGTTEGWKTYTFVFYADEDIRETYHNDWWSWGMSLSKSAKGDNYQPANGYTYIDNVTLVETQATAIAIDSENIVLEPGDVTEAMTVTATPAHSAYADIVWSSDAEGVAKVDAATGVITAVANGKATITATAGALTDTITVTVQKDKTQKWADLSTAIYRNPNSEKHDQSVPVNVDTATGLEYVSVNGADSVRIPSWAKVTGKGQWIGITFLIRVTDGANNAGSVRGGVQMQNIVDGYTQPEFYARTNAVQGNWERVTFYAKSYYEATSPWYEFITLSGGDAATRSYDIADVSIFLPEADDVNLLGAGTDFEEGYAPHTMGDNTQGGLLTKADAAIVADPLDPNNKVFYISSASAASGAGTYWYSTWRSYHSEDGTRNPNVIFEKGKMYKVSFRVYSANDVAIDTYGGMSFKGTTGTAKKPGQWRTVTTYMTAGDDLNSAYAFHVRFYDEAYIDDLQLYECVDATSLEIVANENMPINSTQQVVVNALPKHAYPGNITIASSNACITVSGLTLTSTKTTGTVTGSTITATSDLLDGEGNPISASPLDITLVYPKELFTGAVDGTMDSEEFTGFKFYSNSDNRFSVVEDPDDATNKVLKITTSLIDNTGYTGYFQNINLQSLKPNSLYRYSFKAKSDKSLTVSAMYDNRCTDITYASVGGSSTKVTGEWVMVYAWFKTGDAPKFDSASWNLQFNYSGGDKATPIYLDNFSFALIDEYENRFDVNGDFELLDKYFQGPPAANQSITTDPADPTNKVLAFNGTFSTNTSLPAFPMLAPYAAYEFTYDVKFDQEWIDAGSAMRMWWGCKNAAIKGYYDSGFSSGDTLAEPTEWKKVKITIFTGSASSLPGDSIYFTAAAKGGTMYIDNFSFKRLDTGHSLFGTISGGYDIRFAVNGGSYKNYLLDVEEGSKVSVTVREHSSTYNKILAPLVLKTAAGESLVLNKDVTNGYTEENFGTGKGRTFEFIMGESGTCVSATLTSASTTNFNLSTVGTSLRYTGTEGVYNGIRFLSRLTMPDGVFLADDLDNFKVIKDGTSYTVVEIGSYLKRYSETEGVEDTIETEEDARWISVAYRKGDAEYGDMKLLDYTETYIDFTSVMLKGENVEQDDFNARKYTARGYMVLEDAEGNQITVLATEQTSASVNEIAPLV